MMFKEMIIVKDSKHSVVYSRNQYGERDKFYGQILKFILFPHLSKDFLTENDIDILIANSSKGLHIYTSTEKNEREDLYVLNVEIEMDYENEKAFIDLENINRNAGMEMMLSNLSKANLFDMEIQELIRENKALFDEKAIEIFKLLNVDLKKVFLLKGF